MGDSNWEFVGDVCYVVAGVGTAIAFILRFFAYTQDGRENETYEEFVARMEVTEEFRAKMQNPEYRARMGAALLAARQAKTRLDVTRQGAARATARITEAGDKLRSAMEPASEPSGEMARIEAVIEARAWLNDELEAAEGVRARLAEAHAEVRATTNAVLEAFRARITPRAADLICRGGRVGAASRGAAGSVEGSAMEPMEIRQADTMEAGRRY